MTDHEHIWQKTNDYDRRCVVCGRLDTNHAVGVHRMIQREDVAKADVPEYSFVVLADETGGWVIIFPELHGCMTQADTWEEIGTMAKDALETWLPSEEDRDREIPPPSTDGLPGVDQNAWWT